MLAAQSRAAVEVLIDDFDADAFRQEPAGELDEYDLIRFRGRLYAVPKALGPVDLCLDDDRTRPGIVSGATEDDLRTQIAAERAARPVEFAGWMPVFRQFGNCGAHPQFSHTEAPPAGYRFVRSRSAPPEFPLPSSSLLARAARFAVRVVVGARALARPLLAVMRNSFAYGPRHSWRTLRAIGTLYGRLRRRGGRFLPVLKFLHSRHFLSQLMLPRDPGVLFLTSIPYTYGQNPWVIEVEDSTTLFFPYLRNGETAHVDPQASPYLPLVKELLEADSCKGIVTHMRSTAEMLPRLFRSEVVAAKTYHVPLGVKTPAGQVDQDRDDEVHLLFTNSWHQSPEGFFLRGGLETLEAFTVLRQQYPHLRLTMRTSLPRLSERHARMIESGWVRIINRFLPAEQLDALQRQSNIYLLPAARIHIVSLLQAMSYGQAVVVSDGWGFNEYVNHERNGLIVPGRHGKISWMDADAGLLREDYLPLHKPDPLVVQGIVDAVARLVEDRELRRTMAAAAREDVRTKYNLANWNAGLKKVFDAAHGER
ncbi:MAG: glycosyltransferase [Gemmataceae bacterium]